MRVHELSGAFHANDNSVQVFIGKEEARTGQLPRYLPWKCSPALQSWSTFPFRQSLSRIPKHVKGTSRIILLPNLSRQKLARQGEHITIPTMPRIHTLILETLTFRYIRVLYMAFTNSGSTKVGNFQGLECTQVSLVRQYQLS